MNAYHDAQLLRAAPDLLAACQEASAFVAHALEFYGWDRFPITEDSIQQLHKTLEAAINKAEGN